MYFYTIIILFSILYVPSCNRCLAIYWLSLLRLLNISYPPHETRFPTVEMKFNEFVLFFFFCEYDRLLLIISSVSSCDLHPGSTIRSTSCVKRYELKFYKSFYYVVDVVVRGTSMKFNLYGDDVCYLSQCVQKW